MERSLNNAEAASAQPAGDTQAPARRARRSLGTWLALAFSLLSIFLTVLLVEVVDVAATR
ncbi:hypothetical protein HN295_19845, partial [Acinetobacter baumannii]|nr:hypothetical protein [Acinetobacter baumannii]